MLRLIAGFSVLVALVIGFDLTEWIRGGFGWRWPHDPTALSRVVPLGVAVGVYVGVAYLLLKRTRRAVPVLAWALFGTVVITLATIAVREDDIRYALFTRTASFVTTGPHWAAAHIDWTGDEWRDWTVVMGDLGGHLGTSPPGLPMWYGLLNDIFDDLPFTDTLYRDLLPDQCHNYDLLAYTPAEWSSAWFGILMPLWAGLAVFPIYGIARRLISGDGRGAPLWWALIPGVMGFAGSWSTFYPLVSAAAFWLLLVGLDASGWRRVVWLVGAGLLTGVALFAHFTFLPLLGLFGFYTLGRWWFSERDDSSWTRPVIAGVWVALGIAIPWLIYALMTGLTPLDILQASFDYHLDLDRPYAFWVWFHVWDWILWTGVALAVLWIMALRDDSPPLLAWSLLLTVLVLTISGATQGESGRIWLFLSPFMLVAAYHGLRRIDSTANGWVTITTGQAVLVVVIAATMPVIGSEYIPPPDAPDTQIAIPMDVTVHDSEGGAFRLVGWSGETRRSAEAHEVVLSLTWEGVERNTEPYWFGAFLIPPEGNPSDPVIWQPGEFIDFNAEIDDLRYPTTCWMPGDRVGDVVRLPLPAEAMSGEWWISLAVFGDETQPEGRLQMTTPDGTTDLQTGIGPIRVD